VIIQNLQVFKQVDLTGAVKIFFEKSIGKFSADTLGWLAVLFLHGATIPGMLAMMSGLVNEPPPVDIVMMVWAGLLLMFCKAAIQKDMLNLITIGIGFLVQALMLVLVFYK
jgi:hypothetical protein